MDRYLLLPAGQRDRLLSDVCTTLLRTASNPLQRLRLRLLAAHGSKGFLVLSTSLRKVASQFKRAYQVGIYRILAYSLSNIGLALTDAEIEALRHDIEEVLGGRYPHFVQVLHVLRPPLATECLTVINKTFDTMNPEGTGIVACKKLKETYNVFVEQEVFEGAVSADDAMKAFIGIFWRYGTVPGYVARSEFVDYYTGVCASVADDKEFKEMMFAGYEIDKTIP